MRWSILLLLAAVFLSAPMAHADVCVKKVIHYDEYYSHGVVTPASDVTVEIWFGEKRMAYHGDGWLGIVDAAENMLYIASMNDSVYFEFPLPLVCGHHVTPQLFMTLGQYFITGSVERHTEGKTIMGLQCDAFSCKNDITYQDNHFYDAEQLVWITDDVTFDWKLFNEMNDAIRHFFGPRDEYLQELEKLKGFEMASENKRYNRGDEITTSSEVIEIKEREAPERAYSVPGGFTKRDTIERNELISLRGTIYR